MADLPGINVKWRWWYPEGAIQIPGWEDHLVDHLLEITAEDGVNIASDIVDDYMREHALLSDKCEVEISEPAAIAGIYNIEIEWHPIAVASRREA